MYVLQIIAARMESSSVEVASAFHMNTAATDAQNAGMPVMNLDAVNIIIVIQN